MQEAAFKAMGLKAFYLPFEVRPNEFRRLLGKLPRLQLDGFNITVPYKAMALEYLDRLTPKAKAIRAVNTVFRKKGRWVGDNTDCKGFLDSLRKEGRFNPRHKRVLILGAGGASRAVAYGLAQSGAREIRIANREKFRVRRQGIVRDFKKIFPKTLFREFSLNPQNLKHELDDIQLIINATSVGVLFENKRIIPFKLIPRAGQNRRLLFFDLGYHKETTFLKDAKKKGHRTLNGTGMLVRQGAEAFRLWTGKPAPVKIMRNALRNVIARQRFK